MSNDENKIYAIIIFTIIACILIIVPLFIYGIKQEKRKNKLTKLQIEALEKHLKKPIKINNEKIKEKSKLPKTQLLLKEIENIKKELNKLKYGSPE
jgi:hypothetical protein